MEDFNTVRHVPCAGGKKLIAKCCLSTFFLGTQEVRSTKEIFLSNLICLHLNYFFFSPLSPSAGRHNERRTVPGLKTDLKKLSRAVACASIAANTSVYDGCGFRSCVLSPWPKRNIKTKLQINTSPAAGINTMLWVRAATSPLSRSKKICL